MIKKPWKIGIKLTICVVLISFMGMYLATSIEIISDDLQHESDFSEISQLQALCNKGEFKNIESQLRYSTDSYKEKFSSMWEIASTYDLLCNYEAYELAAFTTSKENAVYYMEQAQAQKASIEEICNTAVYPENEKAYAYFSRLINK